MASGVNKVGCVERLFHETSVPSSQPLPLKPQKGRAGLRRRGGIFQKNTLGFHHL